MSCDLLFVIKNNMVNNMPFFSIILCNYNYGDYVGTAIKSVLNQSFTNFELIVVDDGSNDNSKNIISDFSDPRLKVIFKENGGQASAFNAGFEHVNGRWLSLLDSDDWWLPDRLERLYAYISYMRGGFSVVQHFMDEWMAGESIPYKNLRPSGDVFSDMIKTKNLDYFMPTSALNFPVDVAIKIFPIPNQFWYSADAYLMRTAIVFGNLFTIPEVLGGRRVHGKSFTSTVLKDNRKFLELLIPHLNNYYEKQGLRFRYSQPTLWRRMLHRLNRRFTSMV